MTDSFRFRQWYASNGEMLNVARKVRYHTDEDYQTRVLETNRRSRRKRREKEVEEKRKKGTLKTGREVVTHKTVSIDGVEYMTIGFLSEYLGRCIQTIRSWEAKGVLPEASKRTKRGDRLYTLDEAKKIRAKLEADGKLSKDAVRVAPASDVFHVRRSDGLEFPLGLFSVRHLAKACERSPVTLVTMEQNGALPETPFRWGKYNKRLYSTEMIAAVREVFLKMGGELRGNEAREAFRVAVHDAWSTLGVLQMKIREA